MSNIDKLYANALAATKREKSFSGREVHGRLTIARKPLLPHGTGDAFHVSGFTASGKYVSDSFESIADARKFVKLQSRKQRPSKKASESFFRQYLATALWSSNDESNETGGEPLDSNYSIDDFTKESLRKARKDCDNFVAYAAEDLEKLKEEHGADDGQNGHDFWLTRNGHGAGFWDRGYGKLGDEISKKAKSFGEAHIMVGRGGKLHYEG
jgi:hypothetical protein